MAVALLAVVKVRQRGLRFLESPHLVALWRGSLMPNGSWYAAAPTWCMRAAETRARADEMKEAEPKAIIRLAEWRPQRQTNIALFRNDDYRLLALPRIAAPIKIPIPRATPTVISGRCSASLATRCKALLPYLAPRSSA
jgi:hypothetical protein